MVLKEYREVWLLNTEECMVGKNHQAHQSQPKNMRKGGTDWGTLEMHMFDKQPAGHPVAFFNKWVSNTQHIN